MCIARYLPTVPVCKSFKVSLGTISGRIMKLVAQFATSSIHRVLQAVKAMECMHTSAYDLKVRK